MSAETDDAHAQVREAHKRAHGLTPDSALWDDPRWEGEWDIDPEVFIEATERHYCPVCGWNPETDEGPAPTNPQ